MAKPTSELAVRRQGPPDVSLLRPVAGTGRSRRAAAPSTVVHVTPMWFGEDGLYGGGERFPTELARAMSRRTPTTLVGFGESRQSLQDGELRIEILPVRARWRGRDVNPVNELLPRMLAGHGVVHVHQWESVVANQCVITARLFGAKVFATDHGGWGPNLNRWIPLHGLLHGFLPVSRFSGSFYHELSSRTSVIYGGVDADRFNASSSRRVERALFVGRLLPHKGLAELISCLPPTLPLHVVGKAYEPSYARRLRSLAHGRSVTFDENASDEDVRAAYATSRVVVLPSLDPIGHGRPAKTELLGLTLLEAMASGTPVVCTRTGGMPEVVESSSAGEVVPQRDPMSLVAAIERFLIDGPVWEQASANARAHVINKFTWDAVADRCLTAYRAAGWSS